MQTKITFKDQGQDFLEWIIDENKKVIACKPLQFSIWKDAKVLNEKLKVGGRVAILLDGQTLAVKHPIEKVETIE